jgi:hypothetical protein
MRWKKLICAVVTTLMITSSTTILLNKNTIKVVAAGDGQQGQNNTIGLDYNYMWNVTTYISNAVHNAYNNSEIHKGRAFGSKGCETYTRDYIYRQMANNLSLDNTKVEKLKSLSNFPLRHYASMVDVVGYRLTIERAGYNLSRNVPLSECFPAACGVKDRDTREMTHNYSMKESEDVRVIDHFNNTSWPNNGTLTDDYKNVTCKQLNVANFTCGEVALIENTGDLPDDQTGYLFLVNDTNDYENILDNITNASGVVLLDSGELGTINASKYLFPLKKVDVKDENLTDIIKLLRDNETIFADNIYNYSTITFSYHLTDYIWPPFNFTLLYEWNTAKEQTYKFGNNTGLAILGISLFIYTQNHKHNTHCYELIVYSDNNNNDGSHYMAMTNEKWCQLYPNFPVLPVYYVNYSVGNFLDQWLGCSNNTVSGFINQVYYPGTNSTNGINAYDIVGHINIPKSPDNKIVVISNWPDSWWGECSGDSGAGAGIVLATAKFFKEHNITPKYNLTFLEDAGEEYGFRGAQFYSDNHSDENIIYFIGADQLGMKQPGTHLNFLFKNIITQNIVRAIVNDTHYNERTIYGPYTNKTNDCHIINWLDDPFNDDSDGAVWKRRDMNLLGSNSPYPCDTIVMNKENWTSHHQTGLNFAEGDSLKNTNRSDLNISFEVFWSIVKYFCVNPDCHFHTVSYVATNTTGGTAPDSIKATFTVKSVLPSDLIMVNASLYNATTDQLVPNKYQEINFVINKTGVERNVTFSMPPGVKEGDYYIKLRVYNSTARINRILGYTYSSNDTRTSPTFHLNKYHTLGDIRIGTIETNTKDSIRGSRFTITEDARIDNITAYVYGQITCCPLSYPTYQCMIYRASDGHLMAASNHIPCYEVGWLKFPFVSKPLLTHDTQYIITIWGDSDSAVIYSTLQILPNDYHNDSYSFGTPPQTIGWHDLVTFHQYSLFCWYNLDVTPPRIANVTASPHMVGFGYNVTITENVTDNGSGVNLVKVRIGESASKGNNTMTHISGNMYQYIFTDTWEVGQYNYSIWAQDKENNCNTSASYHFHVSADASMSIATLADSYSGSQYINITDPPNPPENYTLVSRGQTWDKYYDAFTGNNVLESYAGPVNYQEDNGTWMPINNTITQLTNDHPAYNYGYRTGNNRGLFGVYFKPDVQNDWPVAFTYNRSEDPTTSVIRSKLVGVGYADPQSNWTYHYLQDVQSSQGQTNGNSITYPGVFTGTDVTWSYTNTELKEAITLGNTTKAMLQNHPPSFYGLHDASSYLVFITKLDHQNLGMYDTSGILTGNVTISNTGVDFKDALGQFRCALPLGDAYELNNRLVRQKLTYRIIHLNSDTYLLSGLKLSDLNRMTFPIIIDPTLTINISSSDTYRSNSSTNYYASRNASTANGFYSNDRIIIGQRKLSSNYIIYRGYLYFNTSSLPSNAYIDNVTVKMYKLSDYSTTDFLLTVQNGQPTYPHDPIQSTDYNKNYYSGNGGTKNTSSIGTGYNNIYLNSDGKSWINRTGWTKLCLRSSRDINDNIPTGDEYVIFYSSEGGSSYQPKLVITYRNQSKIKNTGLTDIKGYLLIQVQFNQSGQWILDNDTVNETSPRTINSSSQLGLDTIFNGLIRASNLQHGTGTYRVYAEFRDSTGNILKTNNGVELKAWWQFSKT